MAHRVINPRANEARLPLLLSRCIIYPPDYSGIIPLPAGFTLTVPFRSPGKAKPVRLESDPPDFKPLPVPCFSAQSHRFSALTLHGTVKLRRARFGLQATSTDTSVCLRLVGTFCEPVCSLQSDSAHGSLIPQFDGSV